MKILVLPIDLFDRIDDAESIENSADNNLDEKYKPYLMELTDFMDGCNNQEINLENVWISYIN